MFVRARLNIACSLSVLYIYIYIIRIIDIKYIIHNGRESGESSCTRVVSITAVYTYHTVINNYVFSVFPRLKTPLCARAYRVCIDRPRRGRRDVLRDAINGGVTIIMIWTRKRIKRAPSRAAGAAPITTPTV